MLFRQEARSRVKLREVLGRHAPLGSMIVICAAHTQCSAVLLKVLESGSMKGSYGVTWYAY